ncbi:hypothetical protein Tco_0166538 [Tanacetum coccineum]
MDDLNITMKEYIRLEEEKAQKHGKVFNWETAMYGKIWYDEDIHDLRSVETEFPAIAFNDELSTKTLSHFETRLTRIYRREVHRVQVFDFAGLPDLMAEGLSGMMLIEHRDAQVVSLFTSRVWRRLFDIRGPLVHELILEFFSTFRFGQAILDLDTPGALQFLLGGARRRMSWR